MLDLDTFFIINDGSEDDLHPQQHQSHCESEDDLHPQQSVETKLKRMKQKQNRV